MEVASIEFDECGELVAAVGEASYQEALRHLCGSDRWEDVRCDVTRIASINVWLRKDEGTGHGDTTLNAEQVVDQVTRSARWALRVARYLVDARLRSFEPIEFADDGSIASVETRALPYMFSFPPEQVSKATRERLQERFGIEPA